MGAWGEDPLANDTALDWIYEIEQKVLMGLRSNEPEEKRAAACLAVTLEPVHSFANRDEVVKALEEVLANKEWIACWFETNDLIDNIKDQIDQAKKVLRDDRL